MFDFGISLFMFITVAKYFAVKFRFQSCIYLVIVHVKYSSNRLNVSPPGQFFKTFFPLGFVQISTDNG